MLSQEGWSIPKTPADPIIMTPILAPFLELRKMNECKKQMLKQIYFPDAGAASRLKVALSTNSPLGTPPTASTEIIMLIGPGFGNVIVCIPAPSAACWS